MKYPFEPYESAEAFIDEIESNPSGHYPIGTSMFWHSGIHIFCDSQKEFGPLINGKVVCYRISPDYKQVQLPAVLDKKELEDRWSDYKDFYDKEGRIKNSCTNETYPISDCFVLLEHTISINGRDFTFHTLYMNLAPACDNENYDKSMEADGAIHGSAINSAEESFFVDKIGLPAKDKKHIYFDLAVLSKESIEDFSSTDAGIKAFWGIAKTTGFYTREQPEEKSIKIFIPKWTGFDCEEYADNERKAYKIILKSFNVYFDNANAVKDRKLTDTSGLSFSRGKLSGNEDILNPTEEKRYISDIVRNEVIALKGKEVDYHPNEKFWYIKVVLRQPVTVWTRKKVTENDISGKVSFVIDGYKENPLRYRYEEADCCEDIKSMVSDISETPLPGVDGKNYYKVEFNTPQSEEYFVREPDRDACMASLLNFKKWFYFCDKSDSIVCDRTELIKSIIEKHDNTVRKAMLTMPIIGIWWKGGKLTWDLLKYVYGELSSKNDSLEGMLTKAEVRKAVCRHPIEWDKSQFSKLKENAIGGSVKTRLVNESSAIDLWDKGLKKIFSDSPYFYHPIYFINHFEKAGLLEFNPYAGKKYSEIYSLGSMPIIVGNNITESGDSVVVDNPGFAPVWAARDGRNPNIDGYACVTGFFNENYLNVRTGNGKTYRENKYKVFTHEGVDFRGPEGTEIKSFIYGNVLAYGTFSPYGRTVFVSNKDNTGIFLLGHLKEYNKEILDTGKVSPGDTVGKVGTSGPSDTEGNIDGKYTSHLHITYFIINIAKDFIIGKNGETLTTGKNYSNDKRRNPFNYESKKTVNKK